jgi:MoxR-like ATPase
MKPIELKSLIVSRFKALIKRPVHIESSPGLGKTQIAFQVAKELGVGFKAIHAPLLQPEDYGFPVISIEGSDCEETGIFLIDELPQADNSAQKILANLVQEREIHGRKLKSGWSIITTGNRSTDRAGASRLLSHLKNRLTTVELEASLDDWTQWALTNGVQTEVVAFIRFRPELLNNFDAQAEINPTPRSWVEGVSATLGVVDSALEFPCFKGDVGEGAAAEFVAFLKIFRKLPSVDAIMINPLDVAVPKDPATLYAICGALSAKVGKDSFGRAMQYVNRMPAEFSVLFVRDSLKRNPDIQASSDFIAWASGPGAKLLT